MEPTEIILKKIIDLAENPEKLICYCAGFELGKWRCAALSRHLISWLPAAILRPDEYPANLGDWPSAARKAAFRFFQQVDPAKRGELGELILHIICRLEFNTHPTLAKMFYKSATNDVVKGFDVVHTKYYPETDEIELWLGEAKFYSDGYSAAKAAITSIAGHLEQKFLQQEKALIGPLLRQDTPGYHKLAWMFNDSVPLDEIVNRLVIPTLVTFDSEHVKNFCGDYLQYANEIQAEIEKFHGTFSALSTLPIELKLIYVPLGDKAGLCNDFVRRLETFQ
jgi:hypothetical protein